MHPLHYHVASSLDGYIAHPDDTFDGFPMEGDHIADFIASWSTYDCVLMGRRTYEQGSKVGVLDPYPMLHKYVFSRSLGTSPHPNVTVIDSDAASAVRELKQRTGDRPMWLCGGSQLATTLLEAGLLDEVIVKLNPRVFGEGIPLFAPPFRRHSLELADVKRYDSGVLRLTYRCPSPLTASSA